MKPYLIGTIVLLSMPIGIDLVSAQELPTDPIPICGYARNPQREAFSALDPTKLATANEQEPNNSSNAAQAIPLGYGAGQEQDVDITGEITPFDQDFFSFTAKQGETIGVAVLAVDADQLDSQVSIRNAAGNSLLTNNDHRLGAVGIADLYPPESPFPAGGANARDSVLTFAIPADGTYYVHIKGFGASRGQYLTQIRLRKPPMQLFPAGTKQILFLDFDGATLNANELFGDGGNPNAALSPIDNFLVGWGIPADRRDDLIDAIVQDVEGRFQALLGNNPTVGIEIINSKDDTDPFGPSNPLVSRVIVGGTINQLGIPTIGIAEYIDPANYSTNDSAVVLLDLLSAARTNPNSVLSILGNDPSLDVRIQAVARVVGTVVTHEACHFLGCWHTDNGNSVASVADRGGNLPNLAGTGSDGLLGTFDDVDVRIVRDHYAYEGVGQSQDIENVDARVLAALAVGTETESAPAVQLLQTNLNGFNRLSSQHGDLTLPFVDTRKSLNLAIPESVTQPKKAAVIGRYEKAVKEIKGELKAIKKMKYPPK